ncbi:MAG: endolytic transglycosylase MltG [Xanthobacteraceae bacterium]
MTTTDSNRADAKRIVPRSARTAIEPDEVDLPARRSASARHPLIVIGNAVISIFVLLAVVAGVVLFIGKQRFEEPGPLPQDRIVSIPHGSGIRDIADVLTREGVIDQPWVFLGGVLVLKAREGLKAGEYEFKAHSSLRDVVATIVEGKVVPHQVSIPEGLTSQQIVARLLADDVLIGDIKEIPPEGSLLPDTYNFTRGVTREQMIQRMQQAEQRVVEEIWEHRSPDVPLKTPEQLVTLASLVEKETGKPDERSRVAAVFVNRLKQNMRLQSDPTIIYGLVGGKGTLGRPIMKNEIAQPTPFNTYVINGLPPSPITNPGRASLEAAANPARTRDLYFVADGTGGHIFAETYEQQQKNVARLRLIESDQKDQSPIDEQMNLPSPEQDPTANSGAPPPLRGTSKPHAQTVH